MNVLPTAYLDKIRIEATKKSIIQTFWCFYCHYIIFFPNLLTILLDNVVNMWQLLDMTCRTTTPLNQQKRYCPLTLLKGDDLIENEQIFERRGIDMIDEVSPLKDAQNTRAQQSRIQFLTIVQNRNLACRKIGVAEYNFNSITPLI